MKLPMEQSHQDRLRSLAADLPGERVKRVLIDAADRLDEVETHVKIVNRLGGLGSEMDLDVRLKVVESEILVIKRMMGQFATRLDLETLSIEWQSKGF